MFRNNLFTILLFCSLCVGVTTASAEVIFSDSFESGDMSASNADGFAWDKNNRTSVVTQDLKDGPVGLYNNKQIYNIHDVIMPDGSTRDWTAKDGKNSLKFRYAADKEWTEQRFDFGTGYPEIWLSYHIRVPINYHRGPDHPTTGGRNNKWMTLLMGNMSLYSSQSVCKVIISDWPNADGSGIELDLSINNSGVHTNSSPRYVDFVTPADAGRWMQVIYHLKASSSVGAGDAIVSMYRKWDDTPGGFTYITGYQNTDCHIGSDSIATGYLGWGGGYFMGYANDPYANDTEWLMDNFIVSTTSLLPNPPLPPGKVTVE